MFIIANTTTCILVRVTNNYYYFWSHFYFCFLLYSTVDGGGLPKTPQHAVFFGNIECEQVSSKDKALYRMMIPTGDRKCPLHLRFAKRIQDSIKEKVIMRKTQIHLRPSRRKVCLEKVR